MSLYLLYKNHSSESRRKICYYYYYGYFIVLKVVRIVTSILHSSVWLLMRMTQTKVRNIFSNYFPGNIQPSKQQNRFWRRIQSVYFLSFSDQFLGLPCFYFHSIIWTGPASIYALMVVFRAVDQPWLVLAGDGNDDDDKVTHLEWCWIREAASCECMRWHLRRFSAKARYLYSR